MCVYLVAGPVQVQRAAIWNCGSPWEDQTLERHGVLSAEESQRNDRGGEEGLFICGWTHTHIRVFCSTCVLITGVDEIHTSPEVVEVCLASRVWMSSTQGIENLIWSRVNKGCGLVLAEWLRCIIRVLTGFFWAHNLICFSRWDSLYSVSIICSRWFFKCCMDGFFLPMVTLHFTTN